MDFTKLADEKQIERTIASLAKNGITALVVENGAAAKQKALEFIPKGAEIMAMTSVTLDTLGLAKELNESGNYDPVRAKITKQLGAAPDWVIGSVHAVTESGHVFIASQTGSQLSAYAYGANYVLWIVGTQKIVADDALAQKRIYEHCLVLEGIRAEKAYGKAGSAVNKILTVNGEIKKDRITIIFVKEVLGF